MKKILQLFITCHTISRVFQSECCHCCRVVQFCRAKTTPRVGSCARPNNHRGAVCSDVTAYCPRSPEHNQAQTDSFAQSTPLSLCRCDTGCCRSSTKQTQLTVNEGEKSIFIWLIQWTGWNKHFGVGFHQGVKHEMSSQSGLGRGKYILERNQI